MLWTNLTLRELQQCQLVTMTLKIIQIKVARLSLEFFYFLKSAQKFCFS